MIKSNKQQHAYAVAAQFGGTEGGFIACCPYVANTPEVATASVVALVMSETKTTLPLIAVNATELSIEWLRGAINVIEASEKAEEAEKPKVVHLVSDNLRPVPECPAVEAITASWPTPETIEAGNTHSLACPRRWGGWGACRCGQGDGAA